MANIPAGNTKPLFMILFGDMGTQERDGSTLYSIQVSFLTDSIYEQESVPRSRVVSKKIRSL